MRIGAPRTVAQRMYVVVLYELVGWRLSVVATFLFADYVLPLPIRLLATVSLWLGIKSTTAGEPDEACGTYHMVFGCKKLRSIIAN